MVWLGLIVAGLADACAYLRGDVPRFALLVLLLLLWSLVCFESAFDLGSSLYTSLFITLLTNFVLSTSCASFSILLLLQGIRLHKHPSAWNDNYYEAFAISSNRCPEHAGAFAVAATAHSSRHPSEATVWGSCEAVASSNGQSYFNQAFGIRKIGLIIAITTKVSIVGSHLMFHIPGWFTVLQLLFHPERTDIFDVTNLTSDDYNHLRVSKITFWYIKTTSLRCRSLLPHYRTSWLPRLHLVLHHHAPQLTVQNLCEHPSQSHHWQPPMLHGTIWPTYTALRVVQRHYSTG